MNQKSGGKKVFISYKRNVEPDQQIAQRLRTTLEESGYIVFMDRNLRVGQNWAQVLKGQVCESDFFIPLLSASSCSSEMLQGEIAIALDHAAKNGDTPQILPVRLALTGPLPYPLSGWLDLIQSATWQAEQGTDALLAELLAAIQGTPLSSPPEPAPRRSPLPSLGGTVALNDPTYIRRKTDAEAYELISHRGVTFTIKGSRQMGKSSLLVRVLAEARTHGKSDALIDFQLLGSNILANNKTFFQWFVHNVAMQLGVPSFQAEEWDSHLADSQNCTRLIERCVDRLDQPVVVAIDEADRLFASDVRNEFFGMLRVWHNSRAYSRSKAWKNLDLVLVTSTEPNLFIDRMQSPFNVGKTLQLSDFTQEEVRQLNLRYNSPRSEAEIGQLFELLNGQPHLTHIAFDMLEAGLPFSELLDRAADDDGPFGEHLRTYFFRLLDHPDLTSVLKQICLARKRNPLMRWMAELVFGRQMRDRKLIYRLQALGLVKIRSGKALARCRLYADYFGDNVLAESSRQADNGPRVPGLFATVWRRVSGWPVVGPIAAFIVGAGISVMSMSPPEFRFAKICFTAAAVILLPKIAYDIFTQKMRVVVAMILAILALGTTAVALVGSWRWVNQRQALQNGSPASTKTMSPDKSMLEKAPVQTSVWRATHYRRGNAVVLSVSFSGILSQHQQLRCLIIEPNGRTTHAARVMRARGVVGSSLTADFPDVTKKKKPAPGNYRVMWLLTQGRGAEATVAQDDFDW